MLASQFAGDSRGIPTHDNSVDKDDLMNERIRWGRLVLLVFIGASTATLDVLAARAQELLPDIVPWVREDAPYLVNWDLSDGNLRMQTMFANIGDGLFEIRTDLAGTGGATTPVTQRVFRGVDNGPVYTDYFVESAVNFHQAHGHLHFENFSEFQLLAAVIQPDQTVAVGDLVARTVKTSYHLSDSARIPDPAFANKASYPSSNAGLYQTVSAGFGDIYSHGTEGQSISLAGVPAGPLYWLRQIVDPTNVIREKSDANNSFEILIDLTRPGEALRHFDDSFVRPGELAPPVLGDLTGERVVNIQDWLAFKAAAAFNLSGVDNETAWLHGDFNLDRQHTLGDVLLFRQYYEAAVGVGSFDAIAGVPEPAAVLLVAACAAPLAALRRRGRAALLGVVVLAASAGHSSRATAGVTLFQETFDGLTLGPNVDEAVANAHAWTDVPPAGWTVNDSGMPFVNDATRGVKEWEGWSFADKDWWVSAAGDQNRSQFTLGHGTVAVADPDEWDDKGNPVNGSPFAGYYNALFTAPNISLAGAAPGAARLKFASSWLPECCDDGPNDTNNQTATIRVSFNDGAYTQLMRWESNQGSAFYKDDAPNETVTLNLNNPAGAANVKLEFGLTNAGNDWWWAVDNVELFTPTILEVNAATGAMALVGATQLTGYEITSSAGSLAAAGWQAGNLDSQNVGPTTALTADFNNDNAVDGADLLLWQQGLGAAPPAAHAAGDANGDAAVDAADLAAWNQQYGQTLAPGESWETILATNKQLLEFALTGDSTFATRSIGAGYNTTLDARDLAFTYTSADGVEVPGLVRYVSGGAAPAPEPASNRLALAMIAMLGLCTARPNINGP
jgi:hypothetical protein